MKPSKAKVRAFSLVEMLTFVSLLGILAMMGYFNVTHVTKSANRQKLESEVATLNSAIAVYLDFGGDLDSLDTSDEIVKRLRSVAKSEMANRIPGFSSSMVDDRIGIRYQTEREAATDAVRAFWNAGKRKFELSSTGAGGIAAFYLKDEEDVEPVENDERQLAFFYAKRDSEVWDYNEESTNITSGPSAVETVNPSTIPISFPPSAVIAEEESGTPITGGTKPPTPGGGEASIEGVEGESVEEEVPLLALPGFSIPGGSYPANEFDLQLVLSNPNPAGSSRIFYRVDFGNWQPYTPGTVLEVAADQKIDAQAIASSEDHADSSPVSQFYSATPAQLEPPVIYLSDSSFGVFDRRLIAAVLQDRNGEEVPSTMEFRINDGDWTAYPDDDYLLLDRVDFEDGAVIYGRSVSEDSNYLMSETSISSIAVDPLEMLGTTAGEFYNPDSDNFLNLGKVTNIGYYDAANEYFEWGRISDYYGAASEGSSKSWMQFESVGVGNVSEGSRFQIGELDYYDGKFVADTGADSGDFDITMNLSIDGQAHEALFRYEFDLINTVNDELDLYGWESADDVQIDPPNNATTFEIDGVTFELVLEFGDASSNGMADFNEFHVREESSAGTNVYATLFDRTESQGTIDGTGKAIEVASISETVEDDSDPQSSKNGADFWIGLKSFLNQFLKGERG